MYRIEDLMIKNSHDGLRIDTGRKMYSGAERMSEVEERKWDGKGWYIENGNWGRDPIDGVSEK